MRGELETAHRLTNFLHGDNLDNSPAHPAGWSVTHLLPARTVLKDGTLHGRPLAVVTWDTRLERQVQDAGLLVRRLATASTAT